MIERLSRGKRNLLLGVLVVLVAWFAWTIRSVLNPLLLGYLAAFILHPLVLKVQQHGFSRRAAANLIFAFGFVGAVGLLLVIVLQLRSLAVDLIQGVDVQRDVQPRIDQFVAWVEGTFGVDLPEFSAIDPAVLIQQAAERFLQGEDADVRKAGAAGLSAAGDAATFLLRLLGKLLRIGGLFFLVPLYAYFLLFELDRLHGFVRRYLPKRERARISRVSSQIGEVIANFFRGRLGVCFLKGTFLTVGLMIADVDYAFLFGMGAGFLSLVPFIGPFVGFLGASLIGIVEHGVLGSLVRTGIVFGLGELLEGYVLIPKVLGDSLGLHPLVVLFAILAGGAALGMFGILVALPLTASLVILAREFLLPALQQFADEDGPPPAGASPPRSP